MGEVSLQEIHSDLEILKKDVSELKEVIIGEEGNLSEWAKERLEKYIKTSSKRLVSQSQIEKEFLSDGL